MRDSLAEVKPGEKLTLIIVKVGSTNFPWSFRSGRLNPFPFRPGSRAGAEAIALIGALLDAAGRRGASALEVERQMSSERGK